MAPGVFRRRVPAPLPVERAVRGRAIPTATRGRLDVGGEGGSSPRPTQRPGATGGVVLQSKGGGRDATYV